MTPVPDPLPRDELLAPYLHPYRHYMPGALRVAGARGIAVGGGAFVLASVGGAIATGSVGLATVAVLALAVTLTLLLRRTVDAALVVRRVSRRWDERSELGIVRVRRPHAADEAPDVAHDQYAVTVEDDGALAIWQYIPLAVSEAAPDGLVLVPGRPRFAATQVERWAIDHDTVDAATRLVEAQDHAAELEAAAVERARRDLEAAVSRRELEQETASTVAALRHHTGQDDR